MNFNNDAEKAPLLSLLKNHLSKATTTTKKTHLSGLWTLSDHSLVLKEIESEKLKNFLKVTQHDTKQGRKKECYLQVGQVTYRGAHPYYS